MKGRQKTAITFAVAGGKGGVGKSIVSVALGIAYARRGLRVILVDLDLGAANLHTYLGIIGKTPGLADFILRRASSLEEVQVKTSEKNLSLISGAEFVPGMANPAHWMKMKMMRHLSVLPADVVVIDLGAGVHYTTLDFFGMADRGVIVTMPEPGAVMNAYGFLKAAFFRRVQSVFSHHPVIGPLVAAETTKKEAEQDLTLERFSAQVKALAPEVSPLIGEIARTFTPGLVINRAPDNHLNILVKNLLALCSEKIGVPVAYTGNLPDARTITNYLLNVPLFFRTKEGSVFFHSVEKIADRLLGAPDALPDARSLRVDLSDEEIDQVNRFIDTIPAEVFGPVSRDAIKLKMFFKPAEAIRFLTTRGVRHDLFYEGHLRQKNET